MSVSVPPTTAGPSAPTPLIDEKLNFQSGDPFPQNESAEVGSSYNVVAMLGSQGSGSSTLLNDVFGTRFATVGSDFEEATKGIHRSWCPATKALVLDVEGYSGGHGTGAEIPLAQFVAATSDVVLVSLKQDQIVRHELQYRQVMETVCRTVLGRYNEEDPLRKSIALLYVIRDWDGVMDVERASSRVKAGLGVIWKSVTETAGVEDASFDRYFRFDIVTLAHKSYDAKGYQDGVAVLRERFTLESSTSITSAGATADVPLRDVLEHMGNIWTTVRGLVNISTERMAIAEKMCPCFATAVLEETKRALKTKVNVNVAAEQFKKSSTDCRDKGLRQYDRLAKNYEPSVFQSHRLKLSEAIDAELSERYSLLLATTLYSSLSKFSHRLVLLEATATSILPLDTTTTSDPLLPKIEQLKSDCLREFREVCEAAKVSPAWSYQREERTFAGDMEEIIKPIRTEQAKRSKRPAKPVPPTPTPAKQPTRQQEPEAPTPTPKKTPKPADEPFLVVESPTKSPSVPTPTSPVPKPESMAMVIPTIREISKLSVKLGRILVKTMFKNPFRLR